MKEVLFDTCFLIDLEREIRRGAGKAHRFLFEHQAARPCITWTMAGEFGEGFADMSEAACNELLKRFEVLPMDEETVRQYASIARSLRMENRLIGTNDLWIAAG